MNGLELCVWLNGSDSLAADVLRYVSADDSSETILGTFVKEKIITDRAAAKLRKLYSEGWARDELARADENSVRVISWYDGDYPKRLRDIENPPLVLYVKGTLPDFDRSYSVVGTRRCTPYGTKVAELLGAGLARAEMAVVSGGALGIDGAAHGGALGQNGVTAAILGTGVDIVWPPAHDELFDNILRRGALISEYPLGTPGLPWRFPKRNRIIAALSQGLIVVESPIKGGAMITARLAMEMGRDVWAVPGRVDEKVCEGSNRLLIDGASPLVNIADFIDHLCHFGQLSMFTPTNLSEDERKILKCLEEQGDLTLDGISARSGVPAVKVLQLTTGLQAQSLIYPSGGGRWRAVPR